MNSNQMIEALAEVAQTVQITGAEVCFDPAIVEANKLPQFVPYWCTFASSVGEATIVVWSMDGTWDEFTFAEGMLNRMIYISTHGKTFLEASENHTAHEKSIQLHSLMGDYVDDWDWYEILSVIYGDWLLPSFKAFSEGMNK